MRDLDNLEKANLFKKRVLLYGVLINSMLHDRDQLRNLTMISLYLE